MAFILQPSAPYFGDNILDRFMGLFTRFCEISKGFYSSEFKSK